MADTEQYYLRVTNTLLNTWNMKYSGVCLHVFETAEDVSTVSCSNDRSGSGTPAACRPLIYQMHSFRRYY